MKSPACFLCLVIAGVACDSVRRSEWPTCGEPTPTAFGLGTAPITFIGFRTDLSTDPPHVLRLAPQASSGVSAWVDGVAANEVNFADGELRLRFVDEAGRETELEACLHSDETGSGFIRRCTASSCVESAAEFAPLNSAASDAGDYELVAELQGSDWVPGVTVDLSVSGSTAFVARGSDGLRIVEFDSSDEPLDGVPLREVAHVGAASGERFNDVKLLRGDWAVLASTQRGLRILNVSDPSRPQTVIDEFPFGRRTNGHNVFITEDRAYLARSAPGGGVTIVDLQDPTSPQELGRVELPDCRDVHDLFVHADIAYLNCFDSGLMAVDISDPANPEPLAFYTQPSSHSSWAVDHDHQSWVLSSAETYAAPLEVIEFDRDGARLMARTALSLGSAASVHNVYCIELRCWLAYYQEGLVELDLRDPIEPRITAQIPSWSGPGNRFLEGASGVHVAPPWVFLADTERGLLVYRMPE